MPQYVMVRRKDSLCYVEFIRGKYSLHNKEYIVKLFQNMTPDERTRIRTHDFDSLWYAFWQADCNKNYMKEYSNAKEKFVRLRCGGLTWNPWQAAVAAIEAPRDGNDDNGAGIANSSDGANIANHNDDSDLPAPSSGLSSSSCDDADCPIVADVVIDVDKPSSAPVPFGMQFLLDSTSAMYEEAEWGFPKGRRNINESDVDCAFREFAEETGFASDRIAVVSDIEPSEEIFTGCNNIRYKHVYFLGHLQQQASDGATEPHAEFSQCELYTVTDQVQAREISSVAWFSYEEAKSKIRQHNVERRELFKRINDYVVTTRR